MGLQSRSYSLHSIWTRPAKKARHRNVHRNSDMRSSSVNGAINIKRSLQRSESISALVRDTQSGSKTRRYSLRQYLIRRCTASPQAQTKGLQLHTPLLNFVTYHQVEEHEYASSSLAMHTRLPKHEHHGVPSFSFCKCHSRSPYTNTPAPPYFAFPPHLSTSSSLV